DALGFITELADRSTLKRRTGVSEVRHAIPWKRGVGGKYGATVELPAGCYSDDTQLRLSTSRAIRGDGYFDVESFAKIELPVWLSYSLGGGTSTKAAASGLSRSDVNWFSNFYTTKFSNYLEAGGNGGAMRIQPHIWASHGKSEDHLLLRDVVRNAVCTHGNPRAILGACFHALCLAYALHSGDVPEPSTWADIVQRLSVAYEVIRGDHDLSTFWLPVWEQRTKNKLEDAFQQVQSELKDDLMIASDVLKQREQNAYQGIVKSLGAFDSKSRGSATKTAILSSVLSWMFRTEPISVALVEAVNVLGSDTDTIATMTGAIMGAVSNAEPEGDLLDRQYIKDEAIRLFEIGNGDRQQKSFKYPDLMKWRPPKTMMDAVGYAHETVAVLGLGSARSMGDKWESRGKDSCVWQWLKLSFGQTILAKQRGNLPQLSDQTHPPNRDVGGEKPMPTKQRNSMEEQVELFDRNRVRREQDTPNRGLDELTNEAIRSGFNPEVIGKHVLELSERPNAIELGLAYVAVVVKAKRARIQAQAKSSLRVAD
ncbi:MAG: ADP-ribosylglycohydrolase family protein, partial [Candidatus Sulfotelmatobacter sp.]